MHHPNSSNSQHSRSHHVQKIARVALDAAPWLLEKLTHSLRTIGALYHLGITGRRTPWCAIPTITLLSGMAAVTSRKSISSSLISRRGRSCRKKIQRQNTKEASKSHLERNENSETCIGIIWVEGVQKFTGVALYAAPLSAEKGTHLLNRPRLHTRETCVSVSPLTSRLRSKEEQSREPSGPLLFDEQNRTPCP